MVYSWAALPTKANLLQDHSYPFPGLLLRPPQDSKKSLKLLASQEPFLELASDPRGKQAPNYMLIFLERHCLLDFGWVIIPVVGNIVWVIFLVLHG